MTAVIFPSPSSPVTFSALCQVLLVDFDLFFIGNSFFLKKNKKTKFIQKMNEIEFTLK